MGLAPVGFRESPSALLQGSPELFADIALTVGRDFAVANTATHGEIRHPDRSRETMSLRGATVFGKADGAWKIISHHADLPPGGARGVA